MTDQPKKMTESRAIQTHLIMPGDTNRHGTLYGGNLMRMIDNVSAISFTRHTRALGVTASMDSLNFIKPLPVTHSVCIESVVSGVGSKSVEIFAKVIGENLATGERYLAATAFLTFVSVDANRPNGFAAIEPVTDEEHHIAAGYAQRRAKRMQQRSADIDFQSKISIAFPWQ